jgi:hypothetical protein
MLDTAPATIHDHRIATALERFDEAPPDLIVARSLQQRVDRKYILPKRLLGNLLECLTADYHVVRARDVLIARYETVYFDTVDRQLFDDHRRGRVPRYKVRLRQHCDRRLTFLEVKRKSTHTGKVRLEIPFSGMATEAYATPLEWRAELTSAERRFIDEYCPVGAARLVPRIWVRFSRLTLVGEAFNERATFDWNIEFGDDERWERLPELVIAEIKQARYDNAGPAIQTLRRHHVREETLSKYCLATVRLAPVRANTFRPSLRAVERVTA